MPYIIYGTTDADRRVVTTRRNHPFIIDAFGVLPDHQHAIWTLPAEGRDLSTRSAPARFMKDWGGDIEISGTFSERP